jgi:hypothetical protein
MRVLAKGMNGGDTSGKTLCNKNKCKKLNNSFNRYNLVYRFLSLASVAPRLALEHYTPLLQASIPHHFLS